MIGIQIMEPQISDSAIDSRGAVLTYIPNQPIVEFNYIVSNCGSQEDFIAMPSLMNTLC